ncbi:MAG: metallophosphoesterase [Myxococcota bacterium]
MRTFTWLHYTDLHIGQPEQHLWAAKRTRALDDLARLYPKLGRVDAILFTGDLTFRGSAVEFTQLSAELDKVRERLRELGSEPVLLAVPGNHDLTRPPPGSPVVDALQHFGERRDIRDRFWSEPDCEYRATVTRAFEGWTSWARAGLGWTHPHITWENHAGLLPGDFVATWSRDDLRIGLVGLNSAALQLGGGDYEGKLALDPRQLTQLQPEFDDWIRTHDGCLLMTHHPASWLDPAAKAEFDGEIYHPDRFAVHLCGHNHQQQVWFVSQAFSEPRRTVLGRSLFGVEVGERLLGYSVGQLRFEPQTRRLRLWPRAAVRKADGTSPFDRDPTMNLEDEGHTSFEDLGPSRRPAAPTTFATSVAPTLLQQMADRLDRVAGIASARRGVLAGAGLEALDPNQRWTDLLGTLPIHQLRALLRAAEIPAGDPLFEALAPRPPADERGLANALIDEAARHFAAEKFVEAARLYETIEASATAPADRARAWVNRAAALNGAGDLVAFAHLLRSRTIDPGALSPRGRVNLARLMLALPDVAGAREVLDHTHDPSARAVRQLADLAEGKVPDDPADDGDVLLQVAMHHLYARRCASAVGLALRATRMEGVNRRGTRAAAELGAQALLLHWLGESVDELPDSGGALLALEAHAEKHLDDDAWGGVRELLLACNAEQQEPVAIDWSEPPWATALEVEAGPTPERLQALSEQWPRVGPVLLFAAGRWVALERVDDALTMARRAFAILPGYGQRAVLAYALTAGGQRDQARAHLRVLEQRPSTELTWSLLAEDKLAVHDLDGALELARRWAREFPESCAPLVFEVRVRMRRNELDAAYDAVSRALELGGLQLADLRVLALAATAVPVQRRLAGRIARALEDSRFRGGGVAEALRHHLLLASGAPTDVPIDWSALERSGFVRPMSEQDFEHAVTTQRKRSDLAEMGWSHGLMSFEDWAAWKGRRAGATALRILRGDEAVPAPIPEDDPVPWRGRRVHLSALGVEILVELGLHLPFGEAIESLMLLRDAADFLGKADPLVAFLPVELEETDAWMLPFEGLPVAERSPTYAALSVEEVPAVGVWLGSLGRLPRAPGPCWRPPAGPVLLEAPAAHDLHQRGWAEPFLDACRAAGVELAMDPVARHLRLERRRELGERSEADRIRRAAVSWLGALRSSGKLEVAPVPAGPPLAPLASGAAEPPWVARPLGPAPAPPGRRRRRSHTARRGTGPRRGYARAAPPVADGQRRPTDRLGRIRPSRWR